MVLIARFNYAMMTITLFLSFLLAKDVNSLPMGLHERNLRSSRCYIKSDGMCVWEAQHQEKRLDGIGEFFHTTKSFGAWET